MTPRLTLRLIPALALAILPVLTFRMGSLEPAEKMPELLKAIVDDEGLALVTQWIDTLSAPACQ